MRLLTTLFVASCILVAYPICNAQSSDEGDACQTNRVTIKRVPLDGEDLARAMGIRAYKYTTTIPEGEYIIKNWHEKYIPSNCCPPEIISGGQSTGRRPAIREILIKLPTRTSKSTCFNVEGGRRVGECFDEERLGSNGSFALDEESFSYEELKDGVILFVDIWGSKITGGVNQKHILNQNLQNDFKRIIVYKMSVEHGE